MSGGIAKLIFGGGPVHQLGIAAAAVVALEKGYRIQDMTLFRPGQSGEVPDLILWTMTVPSKKYRLEVVDTHDPVPDLTAEAALRGGYADIIKIDIGRAKGTCGVGHSYPCLACLLNECRERIP